MASTSGVDLSISGLASGFDWKTVVTQLAQAERAPESVWARNQSKINTKNSAYTIIKSYLTQLQTTAKALKDSSLYENRSATSATTSVATASVVSGATTGNYSFSISQLATVAKQTGTANVSSGISSSNDVSAVTLGTANFATAISAGTFSVNGKTVTVASTDSLQGVFTKIATATGNAVTASYDSGTDKITLSSASAITLGSAADTSNFLQAAKLYNNNSGTVASNDTLGRVTTNVMLSKAHLGATLNDGVNSHVSSTNDVSGVTLSSANFATAVTAGKFSVNGATVTIATSDSLQAVFDKISTATSGAVAASYDASTDKISLQNTDPDSKTNITLGAPSDTSNFLTAAKLTSNNSTSVSSSETVGKALGSFTINGIAIGFNALKDTMQNVLDRINVSAAGVTAAYDVANNKFSLTNKTTGDLGISLQDTTGNFLAATGLSGGTFAGGTNLNYTVNGGPTVISQSNTIGADSSGITGLSLNVLSAGTTAVTVAGDSSTVKTKIQDFLSAYNNVQSYITTNSASSTSATGVVTAGSLTGDVDAGQIASRLRTTSFSPVSITGLSATLSQLAGLGIKSNGNNNTITLSDSAALDKALTGNMTSVKMLFTDSTNGLAVKLDSFIDDYIDDTGSLTAHQTALTKQSKSIDDQVTNLEKTIAADSAFWTKQFQAMETAQAKITQELNYITKTFK